MNTIRKIRTISTEGMVRQDIEVPAEALLYGETIVEKIKELFDAEPTAKAVLVGIDMKGFIDRSAENLAFTAIRDAGYGWTMAEWDPKSQYSGLLVTRK